MGSLTQPFPLISHVDWSLTSNLKDETNRYLGKYSNIFKKNQNFSYYTGQLFMVVANLQTNLLAPELSQKARDNFRIGFKYWFFFGFISRIK